MFEEAKMIDLSRYEPFLDIKSDLDLIFNIMDSIQIQAFCSFPTRKIKIDSVPKESKSPSPMASSSGETDDDVKTVLENFPSFSAASENCFGMALMLEKFQMRCAFELLRCFRDNLLQTLLLLENTFSDLLVKAEDLKGSPYKKTNVDIAIEHFYLGEVDTNDKFKVFDYSHYLEKLCKNVAIKDLYQKFFQNDFENIEKELNDYVHNNKAFPDAYAYTYNSTKINGALLDFKTNLNTIFLFFLSSLVVTKARYLSSGEFEDEFQLGIVDSNSKLRYEINGFINFFLEEETSKRQDLGEYLLKNVTDGMELLI